MVSRSVDRVPNTTRSMESTGREALKNKERESGEMSLEDQQPQIRIPKQNNKSKTKARLEEVRIKSKMKTAKIHKLPI